MLPRKVRLTKNGSFNYLYAHGQRSSERKVKFNFLRTKSGVRIGFSVSNKIGKAVRRNLVKRRMRHIAEKYIPLLSPCQAVFIASVGITELSYAQIEEQMKNCLVKSGLMEE
jgi:ribonuclease P protein component